MSYVCEGKSIWSEYIGQIICEVMKFRNQRNRSEKSSTEMQENSEWVSPDIFKKSLYLKSENMHLKICFRWRYINIVVVLESSNSFCTFFIDMDCKIIMSSSFFFFLWTKNIWINFRSSHQRSSVNKSVLRPRPEACNFIKDSGIGVFCKIVNFAKFLRPPFHRTPPNDCF